MLAPMTSLLASIPSPSFNTLTLGPLTLRMYGLCIALGVIAAVVISSKRWEARGGDPDDIGTIALWAVPAGVIGARLYHVATDWKTYRDDWGAAFNITNGGLGIPGGVALGVLVGIIVVKRKHLPVRPLLDVVAPAIPVAQAIGRLGNWFNQELFGRPTTLPWALRIDPEHRPPGYEQYATFHPTFLYEALWNLSLAALLVWIDRKRKLRPGELFLLYVFGYSLGRLWVEEMRIDHASLIWGVRVNIWMSLIVGLSAIGVFVWNRRPGAPEPSPDAHLAPAARTATPTVEPDVDDEPEVEANAEAEADAPPSGSSAD
ncbi:MAG: prolipoprotein diacylglyceryl transferase [Acidimicrobiales bacterium]|nr:prolipoprotein diacylglyceryl transferase [Acidimicrobiales bacterium]HRW36722.1 prolipoprotein diacylglyceryl transferase [Aquihabitans sp.]